MKDQYIVQLDAFRFFAVAAVMFGHWTLSNPSLAKFDLYAASAGVNLFFVLSGFLITNILLLAKKSTGSVVSSLKVFYSRRFLRIFPLYYSVLFLSVLFAVPESRAFFGSLVTYTANYSAGITKGGLGYMTHLWSLSVEEQFYIFFPLLVLFLPEKYHLRLFVALIVASVAFRAAAYLIVPDKCTAWWISYSFTPGCCDCFAAGAILAYLRLHRPGELKRLLIRKKGVFFFAFLVYLTLCVLEVKLPNNLISMVLVRLTCAAFCFWLIGMASIGQFSGATAKVLEFKPFLYLGKITYGLYVYHHLVPWILEHFHLPHARIYYFPSTVLLAAASWHLFELPINKLKSRFDYRPSKDIRSVVA